ncbi:MAG: permease-like cell division protein FtsX [Synergistaceae bacterium]|nr:permease-like cell division protein FtsX [Synergistaceae bacterium]
MDAIVYIFNNTFRLLRRQWVLSLLTLLTAAAMFWLLGIISLASINVKNLMQNLESDLVLQAYLNKNVDIEALVDKISKLDWVSSIETISPEQALESLEERLGYRSHATRLIGENPLSWSIQIRANNFANIDILARTLYSMQEVEYIVYAGAFIKRLERISSMTNSGVITMLFLVLFITSLVIFNTIRISLYSQIDEIAIMSLVGATHGYIAYPFILQGTILSGLGSILAVMGLIYLYGAAVGIFQESMPFLPLVNEIFVLFKFYLVLILFGIGLGWICSYISVSRYISVTTKPV